MVAQTLELGHDFIVLVQDRNVVLHLQMPE